MDNQKAYVMANSSNTKYENLTREDFIKKIELLEASLQSKDSIIQGLNNTIQTLTAKNLEFRDLLEQVRTYEKRIFDGGQFKKLQQIIADKLDEIRYGKGSR